MGRSRFGNTLGCVAALLVALAWACPAPAAEVDLGRQLDGVADELLAALDPALGQFPRKPRLAVWPFEPDTIPVGKEAADDVTDALQAALLAKARDRYELVARDSLKTLITDMERTGV